MTKKLTRGMLIGWLLIAIYFATEAFYTFLVLDSYRGSANYKDQALIGATLAIPVLLFFLVVTAAPPKDSYRNHRLLLRFYGPLLYAASICFNLWVLFWDGPNLSEASDNSLQVILQFIFAGSLVATLGSASLYVDRVWQIEFPDSKIHTTTLFFFTAAILFILYPLLTLIPRVDHGSYGATILIAAGIFCHISLAALGFSCFRFWRKLRRKYGQNQRDEVAG